MVAIFCCSCNCIFVIYLKLAELNCAIVFDLLLPLLVAPVAVVAVAVATLVVAVPCFALFAVACAVLSSSRNNAN